MEIIYTGRNITEKKKQDILYQSTSSFPKRNKCWITFFIILGILVLTAVIVLIVHFSQKNSKSKLDNKEINSSQADNTESKGDDESNPSPNENDQNPKQIESKEELPLEKEFEILD